MRGRRPSPLTVREAGLPGPALARAFLVVGLALPVATGALSVLYAQVGLIGSVEVHPWDDILSALFLLGLFVTPESICVYLFQRGVVRSFMARLCFVVMVVFLYADYVFLPASVYTFLPEAAGTLLWAVWPPLAAVAVGYAVGWVESKQAPGPVAGGSREASGVERFRNS